MTASPPTALRALLGGIVDYAGLFPPAALDLDHAVQQFAGHRRSREAWMLGRFVVPAARLDELATVAQGSWATDRAATPWLVSAIAGTEVARDVERIAAFNARHRAAAVVDTVEARVCATADVAALAAQLPRGLRLACELPYDGPVGALLAALRQAGGIAKFRTGGLTVDAFPSSAALADVLAATLLAGVPFKATAGLHHPLRRDLPLGEAGAIAPMHGFLNLFVGAVVSHAAITRAGAAGVGAAEREALVGRLVAVLDERDPSMFTCSADGVAWRAWRVDVAGIERARRLFALSFGSCSFDEPVHELTTLGFAL